MPAITVYVVVIVGVTITVPDGVGLEPVLDVHAKGPALPETDKLADCPLHIVVLEGVTLIVKFAVRETVATAVAVHDPEPDNTVYVVVAVGETATLAELAGFAPLLAAQVKGAIPLEDKVTVCPEQIVDKEGVIAIVEGCVTLTVTTVVLVQPNVVVFVME